MITVALGIFVGIVTLVMLTGLVTMKGRTPQLDDDQRSRLPARLP